MPDEPKSTRTGKKAGGSVPVPAARKRAKADRGTDAPATRPPRGETAGDRGRRLSSREDRASRPEVADPFSLVLKGEPALPFDGWPVAAGTEAVGGRLLPASVASYGPTPETVFFPDDRKRVADFDDPFAYPWRAICRLIVTARTGEQYLGTGWLISPRTVATAGHNVWLHRKGGWAAKVEVTPAYLDGSAPFGSQESDDLRTVDGWAHGTPGTPSAAQSDYGAIVLPRPFSVGFFGFGVYDDPALWGMTVNVYGYPADKNDGSALWGHFRKLVDVTPKQLFYNIDTYGGQSGCPVFVKEGDEYTSVGIHNYGGESSNFATRIDPVVYADLEAWKA
ncbi:MAG: hypothetical protein K2X82_05430 [Gemmataceae bacterium]|nr:hypothetical protein [Gemmataceae bacterium]